MSERDERAGGVEEGFIDGDLMIIRNQQSSEVALPGEGALDFLAVGVAAQGDAIVEGWFAATAVMRTDRQDSPVEKVSAIQGNAGRTSAVRTPITCRTSLASSFLHNLFRHASSRHLGMSGE